MNFNSQIKSQKIILNHEGAVAYPLSVEMELYTAVVTTLIADIYYEKADERIERISALVEKADPRFVAQIAIYARKRMNLRSVPILLLVELARVHKGDDLVARAIANTLSRADEIAELLTCYQMRNPKEGKKKLSRLSHQVQAGLRIVFNKFDEYAFAKYDHAAHVVSLRDALFLVHPKAKDAMQQQIFDKIASRSLTIPYTWETELTALGKQKFGSAEEKKQAFSSKWEELVMSNRLGYMALLRNLRNILKSDVSLSCIEQVAYRLRDPQEVEKSQQMPFRFLAAYHELMHVQSIHTPLLLDSLEEAVKVSAKQIQVFLPTDRVLLACDASGSMQTPISRHSTIQYYDIGLMLAMLLQSSCKQVTTGIFGDTWKVIPMPTEHILANSYDLHRRVGEVGYSTYGYKVLDWLLGTQTNCIDQPTTQQPSHNSSSTPQDTLSQDAIDAHTVSASIKRTQDRYKKQDKVGYNKVLFFTDCQLWDEYVGDKMQRRWHLYKRLYHPSAKLYIFDLSGYGQVPFREVEKDVFLLAGWSDKVFDMLSALEQESTILQQIHAISV